MINIEIKEKKNALIITAKGKGTKIETTIVDILTDFLDSVINDIIK